MPDMAEDDFELRALCLETLLAPGLGRQTLACGHVLHARLRSVKMAGVGECARGKRWSVLASSLASAIGRDSPGRDSPVRHDSACALAATGCIHHINAHTAAQLSQLISRNGGSSTQLCSGTKQWKFCLWPCTALRFILNCTSAALQDSSNHYVRSLACPTTISGKSRRSSRRYMQASVVSCGN